MLVLARVSFQRSFFTALHTIVAVTITASPIALGSRFGISQSSIVMALRTVVHERSGLVKVGNFSATAFCGCSNSFGGYYYVVN